VTWLAVALLGGLVGLDTTAFPQVMFSRPIVAGTLTGLLFGRPAEGMAAGFVLEAFALIVLPVGAARYPDSGTAAVAGVAGYLAATGPAVGAGAAAGATGAVAVGPILVPGAMALALAFALAWERVGGATVVLQRQRNGRMLAPPDRVTAEELERLHLGAMGRDFLRGAALGGGGGLLGYGLLAMLAPWWALGSALTTGVLGVLVTGMVGTAMPLFGGTRARRIALAAGLLAGLGVVVAL
jgi:mannose/fructose/N-acetylgalactosamine-specific phosphotransferase system component IIC